jgi:hypothetical protein
VIVFFDDDGVAHAVYNQREIRERYERDKGVEKWQVQTLCNIGQPLAMTRASAIRQADLDMTERGHVVTCVRCLNGECDHGVTFDEAQAMSFSMNVSDVRKRWPRLDGECPRGCGFKGIAYASSAHYIYGDW